MEKLVNTLSRNPAAVQLCEYLLVAHPDAALNALITTEKQHFFDRYREKIAVKTKPHITVANFVAHEAMEETIARYIQRICKQRHSFDVELNNYSGFPEHTIYLRVQHQQPFSQLAKELKVVGNYISSCFCPAARFITHPHLTIARRLPKAVYLKAIADYAQRTFYGRFEVDELVLLRRTHQFDTCKTVHVFQFQPKSDSYSLFN